MAVETKTVGDLLPRLSWIIDGTNTVDSTYRPNYLWALEDALKEIATDVLYWSFRAQGELSTTDGDSDYPLADDFRTLIEPSMVFLGSSDRRTVSYIDHQLWDREGLSHQTTKAKPRVFTELGRDEDISSVLVRFHPTPDKTYNLRYRYFAFPKSILADTDGTTVIDRRFPPHLMTRIVEGAVAFFAEMVTREELAVHQGRFDKAIRRMRQDNRGIIGQIQHRRPFHRRMARSRLWDGAGTFGTAWEGGAAGPPANY